MFGSALVGRPVVAKAPVSVARVGRSALVVKAAVKAEPVAVPIKKLDGSDAGSLDMALNVAPKETAAHVVHRYMVMFNQNNRSGNASTKTRSEVRGGGKKPYTQKKTGNARRGTQRSPLMVGGGILFGPKPRDWTISMNAKERRLAFATALQSAAGNITVVESFDGLADNKTKTLVQSLTVAGANPMEQRVLVVTRSAHEAVARAGRNVASLTVATLDSLNIYDILVNKKIVIDKDTAAYIAEYYGA